MKGTRELAAVRPCMVCEVRAETVVILRVWHGAQDRQP
jgi:hypothetical protein